MSEEPPAKRRAGPQLTTKTFTRTLLTTPRRDVCFVVVAQYVPQENRSLAQYLFKFDTEGEACAEIERLVAKSAPRRIVLYCVDRDVELADFCSRLFEFVHGHSTIVACGANDGDQPQPEVE